MHLLYILFSLVMLDFASARRRYQPSQNHKRDDGRNDGYDAPSEAPDPDNHANDFHDFVSRPDIQAPRWNIKVYNEEALAPGYWFLAPYTDAVQDERGPAWLAPHIYDSKGHLVWSGVDLFNGFDVFGFTKRQYQGQDMLSMVYRHEYSAILNNKYEIEKKVFAEPEHEFNMHEFNMVDNGTRLLQMVVKTKNTSKKLSKEVGYNGKCQVRFYGFEEKDSETLKTTFSWLSEDKIPLGDSVIDVKPIKKRCNNHWDYAHCNSLDKFPDGDFLIGCRHTDTIYKISHKDGSIVWRLGGQKNDFVFDEDTHFAGQHDVKVKEANATHATITMLDNANRPGHDPVLNNIASRGLVLSLDTQRMLAETVAVYDHPNGLSVDGRGSFQSLPNGNVFCGFTRHAFQAEYASNGTVLMEAQTTPVMKSYRSYKFNWVGNPTMPPDVFAAAVAADNDETYSTNVWMSWNGATEVMSWSVYEFFDDGSKELVKTVAKDGFETAITHDGFLTRVVVEALDAERKVLGTSKVFDTVGPGALRKSLSPLDVEAIGAYQQGTLPETTDDTDDMIESGGSSFNAIAAFFSGVLFTVAFFATILGLGFWFWRSNRWRRDLPWHHHRRENGQKGGLRHDASEEDFALDEEETEPFQLDDVESGDGKKEGR